MKPLYIQHRPPYQGHHGQETLDALLVAAAFGQNPGVLFQGDGVWQLVQPQQAQALGHASLVAQLQALPLYEVEDIYVDADSLAARGLSPADLALPVQVLAGSELADLYIRHHPVIRF